MTIRAYTPEDFPLVERWARARNVTLVPQLLGKNGFLVEDDKGPLAVAFCYITFDCPLAFVDYFVTRPGTSLRDGLKAWRILWRCIQGFLANLRDCNGVALVYKVVRVFTRPAFARFLKADGWHVFDKPEIQAIHVTP